MYIVSEDGNLIDFFKSIDISKNKIKTYVKLGFIFINDKKVIFSFTLKKLNK